MSEKSQILVPIDYRVYDQIILRKEVGMKVDKGYLSPFEGFWYYLWVFLTLGSLLALKALIKKAIWEASEG